MARGDSATRVLDVVDYLAAQRGPVPAQSIARALSMPRSTVYELLHAMVERGYAVHVPEERRYGLGVRAYELGSGYLRQQPLVLWGKPLVTKLVQQTGCNGHLAILNGNDVVYLVEERSPRGPQLVSEVGVRLPAHLTATGRALLAALPKAQVRALYPKTAFPLSTRTGRGPETENELSRVLEQTRKRGFALEEDEITEGLSSLAVTARDRSGWPIASLAVTALTEDVLVKGDEWTGELLQAAKRLSQSV